MFEWPRDKATWVLRGTVAAVFGVFEYILAVLFITEDVYKYPDKWSTPPDWFFVVLMIGCVAASILFYVAAVYITREARRREEARRPLVLEQLRREREEVRSKMRAEQNQRNQPV